MFYHLATFWRSRYVVPLDKLLLIRARFYRPDIERINEYLSRMID
jgi:hypothetical protein